jgi:hypothetical protein
MDKRSGSEHLLATVRARQELGEEYDQALVEGFVEQVDLEIQRLVDSRVAEYARGGAFSRRAGFAGSFAFIASLVFAIPLSAIAGAFGHLPGLAVAWGGIVLVNVVHSRRSSGRRRRPHQ